MRARLAASASSSSRLPTLLPPPASLRRRLAITGAAGRLPRRRAPGVPAGSKMSSRLLSPKRGKSPDSPKRGKSLDSPKRGKSPDSPKRGKSLDSPKRGKSPDSPKRGKSQDSPKRGKSPDSPKRGNSPENEEPRKFSASTKEKCWQAAALVPGRNPERWRKDAMGTPVCRKCRNCHGCACFEFDHITPYAKGGKSTLDNCQILQTDVNRVKSDDEMDFEALKKVACDYEYSDDEMDGVEVALYGSTIKDGEVQNYRKAVTRKAIDIAPKIVDQAVEVLQGEAEKALAEEIIKQVRKGCSATKDKMTLVEEVVKEVLTAAREGDMKDTKR
ncbi:hypothetical protein ACP4OV_016957 [Aristida adscensionis]